ncbi:MAG TPA: peptide chain release factor 2 [Firmicutes bacterium]|nr:peptide chain release factor 2 [Bacillota bacterium]HAA33860.1 peptide chain release factor 2 [Bacillota bacterium]
MEEKIKRISLLEKEAGHPDFWNDPETAARVMQELGQLKDRLEVYNQLEKILEDWSVLLQMYKEMEKEEEAPELLKEAEELSLKAAALLDREELSLLFKGQYDEKNAILSIHPGAGGLEAQDWAEMLLRMYTRWAEKKGYSVELLDLWPGEEAGIKSVTFLVKGEKAYGYLQAERGVHRLVRISPFDAGGRRHTSFASVDVLPEVEEGIDVDVDPDDLRIDTFRSRGAGGQHVNTTDSAVRITHLPTGLVVQCQNERSQHSNKERAMRILLAKLADMAQRQQKEALFALRGEQKEIAWGSQIRSYVFHPYSLVKDHRTGVEIGDIQSVMDGEIDLFLEAYLRYNACLQA